MLKIYFVFVALGISSVGFARFQAPGTITMNIKYHPDIYLYGDDNVTLDSTVNTTKMRRELYKKADRMKLLSDGALELTIKFDVYNISEHIDYNGLMKIMQNGRNTETYEFRLISFKFSTKKSFLLNNMRYVTATAYSKEYKELEVMTSVKCKQNFYPEFNCSVLCIKTQTIEKCDSNGNKICRKGFYFNDYTHTCDTDWCTQSKPICVNDGHCVNRRKESECVCGPLYSGKYCQIPLNLCQQHNCPNKTYCSVQIGKVTCISLDQKELVSNQGNNYFKVMSAYTILSMFGFVIVFIITILLTIWACKRQRFERYRSMDASIHSSHTYYPNNSLRKASKCCLHCDHENNPALNMYNSIYGNRAFYSLRSPNRIHNSLNRAFSDILIPYDDKRLSMKSVSMPEESLPLPPPIED